MRNVYKFLRASILILILVGGTYFIAQEYSAGIENAVNTSAGGQSLTKETITNLGDVLATVEAEIAGGAGSEKTNDTVKSDYQPVQGTGQLVEDSKSQQTDTTPAASYDFPENMYPYRAMLSDTQKEVYDQVYGTSSLFLICRTSLLTIRARANHPVIPMITDMLITSLA